MRTVFHLGRRSRRRPSRQVGRDTRVWWVCHPGRFWWCYTYRPFRGWQCVWGGWPKPGAFPSPLLIRVWSSQVKKIAAQQPGDESRHLAPVESELLRDLLPLVEHACCRRYDDGDPREPGWWTVKTVGSAWCVQVKDPDSCMSFSVVAPTIDRALTDAALLLGCEQAPWEPDQWLRQKKTQKKSK